LSLQLRLVHGNVRLSIEKRGTHWKVLSCCRLGTKQQQAGWGGAGYYESEETVRDINGRFIVQSKQTWTINPFSSINGPEF
jgi:hypothetical protein